VVNSLGTSNEASGYSGVTTGSTGPTYRELARRE
jgi:hypothetical protein